MSKEFLYQLNGNKNGKFKQFLDSFQGEPRICWYPSAGHDFRPLFYLHPKYAELNPAKIDEPAPPDIFLYTDYYPWEQSTFLDTEMIYSDFKSYVGVSSIEELPELNLTLHPFFVDFPEGSSATDRCLYLEIYANSDQIGSVRMPVLYLFAENEAFYRDKLRLSNAVFSHVIHVRYGSGFGGSKTTGAWIQNILTKLKCESFITDNHHHWGGADIFMSKMCPDFPEQPDCELIAYRTIPGEKWSDHGDVVWYLVKKTMPDGLKDK